MLPGMFPPGVRSIHPHKCDISVRSTSYTARARARPGCRRYYHADKLGVVVMQDAVQHFNYDVRAI